MLKGLTKQLVYPSKNISLHKQYQCQSKIFKNSMKYPSFIDLSFNKTLNSDRTNPNSSREMFQKERTKCISLNKKNQSKQLLLNQSMNINNRSKSKMKQLKIESTNTLDTTQKLKIGSSHSQSTERRTINKSSSYRNIRKKFLSAYINGITKNTSQMNSTNVSRIENAKQDYEENLSILESWIRQIDNEGFLNNSKLIQEKEKKISSLIESIREYKELISAYKLRENKRSVSSGKVRNMNRDIKDSVVKIRGEKGRYTNEINQLREEIEGIGPKMKEVKCSTIDYGEETEAIQKEIEGLNDDIRKLNLKISELRKSKDKILTSKLVIDKALQSVKARTNDKIKTTSHFMLNVHKLIQERKLFNNK